MTFNEEIVSVDTCRVYHSGPNYFVEIDIVLAPEMPLWKAHDISQDLQDQIEALPDVDRCFVHVDHEVDHKPVSLSFLVCWQTSDPTRSIGRRCRVMIARSPCDAEIHICLSVATYADELSNKRSVCLCAYSVADHSRAA